MDLRGREGPVFPSVCAHMPRVLTVCVERYVVRGRKTWVRSFFSHIVGLNIQTLDVPLASRL